MVAVAVTGVEGDHDVRAHVLEQGAHGIPHVVLVGTDQGGGVGVSGHVGVAEAEQLDPADAEHRCGARAARASRAAARLAGSTPLPAVISPASPRVAHTTVVSMPAAAAYSSTDPVPNVSSSGGPRPP